MAARALERAPRCSAQNRVISVTDSGGRFGVAAVYKNIKSLLSVIAENRCHDMAVSDRRGASGSPLAAEQGCQQKARGYGPDVHRPVTRM